MVESNASIGFTFALDLIVMLTISVLACIPTNNMSELRPA